MVIRDILKMKGGAIFSMEPDKRVADAVSMMVRNDIGSLVVMRGEVMEGLVTFREVLSALDVHGGDLADLRLKNVMVVDPVCGHPDDTLDQVRAVMTRSHVRYLPVKDGARLIGIISFHDIAKSTGPDKHGEIALFLKVGTYSQTQALEMDVGGKRYYLMPRKLVEGGEDFDWGRFKVMKND